MEKEKKSEKQEFVEGIDYYLENGLMVLTEEFHRKRGYCCENGCRHCPYGFQSKKVSNSSRSLRE